MNTLTAYQLAEWEAYDRLDPIGTWREDFRMANLASIITNLFVAVYGKKGAKPTTPKEFMIEWDTTKAKKVKRQTTEEMKNILLGLAKALPMKVSKLKPQQPL